MWNLFYPLPCMSNRCKCVFITYTKKICKIVLNFFIMCAKKSCHLVPKYIPLNEDRKNHQNPASYCLSTTCGTSHEGYTIHTDSCQNNTKNGCMNVSKTTLGPIFYFLYWCKEHFIINMWRTKKGVSYNQINLM